ncbi:sugar phosphate isomerase/epimerase family protein [Ferruginibacter paludis]|uniref:sugar phosphate isomerase/epimerase family protein n=1 Tax=Ferruginibacter paludis TaxID=1310417 RepID=UPI0025B33310|nr:sugar phosphate isomerase/epimerase family protein [Ferruginibacter paludis]MDN3654277.1 sugar phosphate isomerase/epimerase family protein [Ferruginibacter paludis]
MLTRRQLLKHAALLAVFPGNAFDTIASVEGKKNIFKIGACDWSLGKSSDIGAFDIAKQIGLDGIMVNMGSLENNLHLRDKSLQQQYLDASKKTGVKISSLAIGELNAVPYKSDARTEEWVWDSVDVAKNLNVSMVLLAFFSNNDLRNDAAGKKEVISRLKKVAPHAEKNGITLGIESYLDADEHMDIIDKVGSKNIKVYYDFRNTADAGFDTVKEFKKLGKHMVGELHMKENGFLLGKGTIDWRTVSNAVYETGYYGDGWMQIEWAMPGGANLVESYQQNLQFLKNIFPKPVY